MGPVEVDLVVGAIERQLDRLIRLSLVDILEQPDSSLRATCLLLDPEIVALVRSLPNSGLGRPKELRGRRLQAFRDSSRPAGHGADAAFLAGAWVPRPGMWCNHRSRTRPASRQGACPLRRGAEVQTTRLRWPCVTSASWWRRGLRAVRSTLGASARTRGCGRLLQQPEAAGELVVRRALPVWQSQMLYYLIEMEAWKPRRCLRPSYSHPLGGALSAPTAKT